MENIISSLLNIKELMEATLQRFNVVQHLDDLRATHDKMHQIFQLSLDELEDQICEIQEEDAVAVEEDEAKGKIKPAQFASLLKIRETVEQSLQTQDRILQTIRENRSSLNEESNYLKHQKCALQEKEEDALPVEISMVETSRNVELVRSASMANVSEVGALVPEMVQTTSFASNGSSEPTYNHALPRPRMVSQRASVRPSLNVYDFRSLLHRLNLVKFELSRLVNEDSDDNWEFGGVQAAVMTLRFSEQLRKKEVGEALDAVPPCWPFDRGKKKTRVSIFPLSNRAYRSPRPFHGVISPVLDGFTQSPNARVMVLDATNRPSELGKETIIGPHNTVHEGQIYQLKIFCDKDYPEKPPSVHFHSRINMTCVNNETGVVEPKKFELLAKGQREYTMEDILTQLKKEMAAPHNKKLKNDIYLRGKKSFASLVLDILLLRGVFEPFDREREHISDLRPSFQVAAHYGWVKNWDANTGDVRNKLRNLMCDLGPSFIKAGQVAFNVIEEKTSFETWRDEFKSFFCETAVEARRPFCNCLIDICRSKKLHERDHELLYLGTLYGLYPSLHSNTVDEWCLDVRSLSVGAAQTALEEWMGTRSKIVQRKEALIELFSAQTGRGTHKFSQGLANSFTSHPKKLDAPFMQSEEKVVFCCGNSGRSSVRGERDHNIYPLYIFDKRYGKMH